MNITDVDQATGVIAQRDPFFANVQRFANPDLQPSRKQFNSPSRILRSSAPTSNLWDSWMSRTRYWVRGTLHCTHTFAIGGVVGWNQRAPAHHSGNCAKLVGQRGFVAA